MIKHYYTFLFQKEQDENYRAEVGDKSWERNNKLHREDGPAIIWKYSTEWYKNGNLHREDGPAIEQINGYKAYYLHGKRHRIDGPAVEYPFRKIEWWVNGKFVADN